MVYGREFLISDKAVKVMKMEKWVKPIKKVLHVVTHMGRDGPETMTIIS